MSKVSRGLKRLMTRTIMKVTEPEKSKKLTDWQEKLETARHSYEWDLKAIQANEDKYNGDRKVSGNPNKAQKVTKVASQRRNITYELVESETDSSIPMPKVVPIHSDDLSRARTIEHILSNFVRKNRFALINDNQERVTYVQGGDFLHVAWDKTKGFHCMLGDVEVTELHPRQVFPQPGCVDIEKMDYVIIQIAQTKKFVKKQYGVDVEDAGEENPEIRNNKEASAVTDIVTVNIAYYRNGKVGIGRFVWCQDYVLSDMEDYQARKQEVCAKCGKTHLSGDVCECGSKSYKKTNLDYEELETDVVRSDGSIIPAWTVVGHEEHIDELGNAFVTEIKEKTKIPYYVPNVIPLILRKNVSKNGKMLGFSDADVISDQQDTINKLASKRNEKALKGGSIVTLPRNTAIETTDEELKVVYVRDEHEKNLIGTFNLQVDPSIDRVLITDEYDFARSTLGITDSFQGKYDPSAVSGTAKQYSINQAAGRLESKRVLKNDAYSQLYEMIFKFMLAYADQKVPYSYQDKDGEYMFAHFNRYDFLKQDEAGEWYWDDEFIFETDPTSTMLMNREAMWQQADLKYQSGAFGNLGEPETMYRYWAFLERQGYPDSSFMRQMFEEQVKEQKMMAQMGLPTSEGVVPPNTNSALLPEEDDYVQTPVEETLNNIPMEAQAAMDPTLAAQLVGGIGGMGL